MASVLIADDDQSVRTMVRTLLESEGYEVLEASDGQETLDVIGSRSPDVLVLDVRMPKLDGMGVLRKLQGESGTTQRVVMLTGAVEEEDHLRAWGAGADDYVTKPFEPEALVGAIERVINLTPKQLEEHRQREIERARLLRQLDRFLE
jgi:DNA-binding response OmpR family regulator